MGTCRYCNRDAGWFKKEHASCVLKANDSVNSIKKYIADAVTTGKKYSDISEDINKLATEANLSPAQCRTAAITAWSQATIERDKARPVSDVETDVNWQFISEAAGITEEEMTAAIQAGTANAALMDGVRADAYSSTIWAALNGKRVAPESFPPQIRNAFNLQTGEYGVWGMPHMLMRQQSTHKSYAGGYNGISVRVANGLWYRFGKGRGHEEEHTELQDVDMGDFLMTNRAIYFGGKQKESISGCSTARLCGSSTM